MRSEEFYDREPESDDEQEARQYERARRRHAAAQRWEDANTGAQIDPMPSFDDWVNGPPTEDETDDACTDDE